MRAARRSALRAPWSKALLALTVGHGRALRFLNIVVHDPMVDPRRTYNFVWTTRPVFLYLTPAYLALCGGYLVLPTIRTVHVDFTVGPEFYGNESQYDPDAPTLTSNDVETTGGRVRLISMYDQLTRALTPAG